MNHLKADTSAVKDLVEIIHAKANREEIVNLQSAVVKLQEFKIQYENNQIMQERCNKGCLSMAFKKMINE